MPPAAFLPCIVGPRCEARRIHACAGGAPAHWTAANAGPPFPETPQRTGRAGRDAPLSACVAAGRAYPQSGKTRVLCAAPDRSASWGPEAVPEPVPWASPSLCAADSAGSSVCSAPCRSQASCFPADRQRAAFHLYSAKSRPRQWHGPFPCRACPAHRPAPRLVRSGSSGALAARSRFRAASV